MRSGSAAPRDAGTGDTVPAAASHSVTRLERSIAAVLRIGVAISLSVIAAGVIVMFVQHPAYRGGAHAADYHDLISASNEFPRSVGGMIRAIGHGSGSGIILVGLFVLFLTPVARVATAFVSFVVYRDRRMATVTAFVLVVLLGSLALGALQ